MAPEKPVEAVHFPHKLTTGILVDGSHIHHAPGPVIKLSKHHVLSFPLRDDFCSILQMSKLRPRKAMSGRARNQVKPFQFPYPNSKPLSRTIVYNHKMLQISWFFFLFKNWSFCVS
jgi:hypothetical protein